MTERISNMLPSELINTAMIDLEACERDPRYHIEMGMWHTGTSEFQSPINDKCGVCLAGAVMAKTLDVNHRFSHAPDSFDIETEAALRALDFFRVGNVECAFEVMEIPMPDGFDKFWFITDYVQDRFQFHADMHALYLDLRYIGF